MNRVGDGQEEGTKQTKTGNLNGMDRAMAMAMAKQVKADEKNDAFFPSIHSMQMKRNMLCSTLSTNTTKIR